LFEELKKSGSIPENDAMQVASILAQAQAISTKVAILRNNLFAHRSASLSYADAFKKAGVTPDNLEELTGLSLRIANRLLSACGLREHYFNEVPRMHAEALLKTLGKCLEAKRY